MFDLYYKYDMPTLDIGCKQGYTDYIDFIKIKDMGENSIMKGVDIFSRKFIVMIVVIDKQIIMQTYFQRYTGGEKWMTGNHATRFDFLEVCGSGVIQDQVDLLDEIMNKEEVIIEEKHRPYSNSYIGEKVMLYDVYCDNFKKNNAAKIIQRHWMLCRYNPAYKMCETVQTNNLMELMSSQYQQSVNM